MASKEDRKFVRVFVRTDEDKSRGRQAITYHLGSWTGPKVRPTSFYPPRFVKAPALTGSKFGEEVQPDVLYLGIQAPRNERINAYVLGDALSCRAELSHSIVERAPGPRYQRGSEESGQWGNEGIRGVCVSYCHISQRDLAKLASV